MFRKKSAQKTKDKIETQPRTAYCRLCSSKQTFNRCWLRVNRLSRCEACALEFENPDLMYSRSMPVCHQCHEFLEHPGFEYGLCEGCGSKYELVDGVPPNLIPNKKQRDAMDQVGRAWAQS